MMEKQGTFSPKYLFLFFLLAFLIFFPTREAWAVNCRTYHWVKEGETTVYIAKTYGFKWRELADVNHLDRQKPLKVGLRLCIPPEKVSKKPVLPKSEQKAKISVLINGDRIYISVDRYSTPHVYRVKARNVKVGVGGWHNLGFLEAPEKKAQAFVFDVPAEMRTLRELRVCLKDLQSNELICWNVVYPH